MTRCATSSLRKCCRRLTGVKFCAVISACYSGNATWWFQGIGLEGVIVTDADGDHTSFGSRFGGVYLREFFRSIKNPEADADGDGEVTFEEAHNHATQNNPNDMNFIGPNPNANAIMSEGARHMQVPDIDIFSEGHRQIVEFKRPAAVSSTSPFNGTIMVADSSIATPAQTNIQIGPGQASVKIPFTGHKCGMTTYTVTGTDENGNTYSGMARIEVGDFTLSERTLQLTLEANQTMPVTVDFSRFGFWFSRGTATTLKITSRSDRVATPVQSEIMLGAGEADAKIQIRAVSAGSTWIDVLDTASFSRKTIRVTVTGGPPPTTGCPLDGSSETSFVVPEGGDPDGHRIPVGLQNGTVFWQISGALINFSGSIPQIVNATGEIDADCNFSATGNSGATRIAGFQNVSAEYLNGKFDTGGLRLTLDYRLGNNGVFPGGRPIFYNAEGTYQPQGSGTLVPQNDSFPSEGGNGSVAVNVASGQQWMAMRNVNWINITSGQSGSGPGRVNYTVAPNTGMGSRTGTLTIAGETFTVNQAGPRDPSLPNISFSVNGAGFQEGFASATWLTIGGANLSETTDVWFSDDSNQEELLPGVMLQQGVPQDALLPTSLGGVSVTINGLPAYISFVSPRQINLLAPDDPTLGLVDVQVTNDRGVSNINSFNKTELAPEMFRFNPQQGRYAAGVHADGTFLGSTGLFNTFTTRPAKPGDIVLLFGTGFGPTAPPTPTDRLVAQPAPLFYPAVVRIGGVDAQVLFGGIVIAGLYQFNIVVPDLPDGDQLLEAFVNGMPLGHTVYVSVER